MKPTDYIYPKIAQIVNNIYEQNHTSADRDEIATQLILDPEARLIVEQSFNNRRFSDEELWEKAANYVDWFNAEITSGNERASSWGAETFLRTRVTKLHPYKNTMREIYRLAPVTAFIEEDFLEIIDKIEEPVTSRNQLILARLGQGTFRKQVLAYWKACAITGCKEFAVL